MLKLQDYYNIRRFLVGALDASKDPNAYNYFSYVIELLFNQLSDADNQQLINDIVNEAKRNNEQALQRANQSAE